MSGQRRWLKLWSRTVGMPVGINDEDKPEFLPIPQDDVYKALWARTFWIVLHLVTCVFIISGNGKTMGFW
jgi:hypothetical protein|tara:strand:- start:3278 stop:3487 length:210 start_codon:yes stop_codon:yes gene_type:complete